MKITGTTYKATSWEVITVVLYFEVSDCFNKKSASVAQLVEHRFRKPEVKGSSPFAGSISFK